jgi:hypothetical protein
MDDAVLQIEDAFGLARELMAELQATPQNDPGYLAGRCQRIAQAYLAASRMLGPHPHGADDLSPPAALQRHHPFGGGDGSGSSHGHLQQLELLRPFLGGGEPSSAPFQQHLGRLLEPSPFNTTTSPDMFGAGTSGGPVRRQASSSRSSPPVQPRQHRRRYVMHLRVRHRLVRTLGFLPLFVNFGGQEFKPGRTETLYHVIAWKEPANFPRTHLARVFVLRWRRRPTTLQFPNQKLRAKSWGVTGKMHEGSNGIIIN